MGQMFCRRISRRAAQKSEPAGTGTLREGERLEDRIGANEEEPEDANGVYYFGSTVVKAVFF